MKNNVNKISVIIPVYNSEGCLNELARRLTDVLDNFGKIYEIVLVNDFSQDNSWVKIAELCVKYNCIKGISLRKNFGQDNALMAGLNYSSGESVIIMDDDLQHDPEDIPALLGGLEKGYDVCYTNFRSKKQTWFKNLGSWFNDKVANIIINKPKGIYLSPYKAIKREVVDEVLRYNGPYPYVDGLIFRVTRNITQVIVKHYTRYAGSGNYNLRKSILVWLKLFTNFSIFPLRIATFMGLITSAIGFIFGLIVIIQYFMGINFPSGWASLVIVVLFMGGIQLITAGIIGEYVGRLFLFQSDEPQFVINEIIDDSSKKE
jgi:polyisoprenyl-phosphate glycosyltransferase